ncbi:MAG: hypothetical protein Q9217_001743 [Psora testacea]
MPSDDLKTYATSSTDFYELLGVRFESSQKDIDHAWRRTALKYHPDKVGTDPLAKEKFHLAQIGYDLLSDPSSKAIYDNARNARLQRQRQNELFEGRRRQMKDELEARERGIKRPSDEDMGEEERLEMEIRRLAEDGKRRRKEREEALRREMQKNERQAQDAVGSPSKQAAKESGQGVAEIDRTVKIRWPVDGHGGSKTADHISHLFSKFGKVESAGLLSPKMARLGRAKKKQLAVTCMITFVSIVGAHTAVEDFSKQQGPEWGIFDSVSWAANKEPEVLSANAVSGTNVSAPSTPLSTNRPVTPPAVRSNVFSTAFTDSSRAHGNGLSQKPSFASFSAAASSTPQASSFGKGLGPNSLSLEEMTMIRLRKLEQKRLAAEIQRQDEEADAAANAEQREST